MTDKKPCELNNTTHFATHENYTTFCEICQLHIKIPKFRSCEARQEILLSQGVDIFQQVRESERLASFQTGLVNTTPQIPGSPNTSKPKQASRRGR